MIKSRNPLPVSAFSIGSVLMPEMQAKIQEAMRIAPRADFHTAFVLNQKGQVFLTCVYTPGPQARFDFLDRHMRNVTGVIKASIKASQPPLSEFREW